MMYIGQRVIILDFLWGINYHNNKRREKKEYLIMPTNEKILQSIMSGTQDRNIKFRDLQKLLEALRFEYRIKGDHHIYTFNENPEVINIQPNKNMAKPYQIKQIRNYIIKYRLGL